MKRFGAFYVCVLLALSVITFPITASLLTGCRNVTPQKATLNSIGTLQVTVHAAYDGYVDAVIAGAAKPEGLKEASKILNEFNSATIVVVRNLPLGTNGVAPPNLLRLASDLTTHINRFHPPKPK